MLCQPRKNMLILRVVVTPSNYGIGGLLRSLIRLLRFLNDPIEYPSNCLKFFRQRNCSAVTQLNSPTGCASISLEEKTGFRRMQY